MNELSLTTFLNQNELKIDDLINIIEFETKVEVFDNLFFKINMPNKIANINAIFDFPKALNIFVVASIILVSIRESKYD